MSKQDFTALVAKSAETAQARKTEPVGGPMHCVDQEVAYGQTTRLPFQIRVF